MAALGPDLVSSEAVTLLAYSHDAFPLALKVAGQGRAVYLPELVVFPRHVGHVVQAVRLAQDMGVPVVPYGGGSGIVGGALALRGGVVIDLKGLDGVGEIDTISRLVTVGAGVVGQRLEDHLNERGYTTGHYPQSLRSSTVGGWIAHRATGTASTRYGGIESLVAGMEVVLPTGDVLRLRTSPRSATGPDLKQLFLGGEGTLGIVTEATLRLWPVPGARRWLCYTFSLFDQALDVVRRIVQAGLRPAVVRLYDATESDLVNASGHTKGRCLLFLSCEGSHDAVEWECAQIEAMIPSTAVTLGPAPAEHWWSGRFNTPALLQTLQRSTGIADALEVSAPWSRLAEVYTSMRGAMLEALHVGNRSGTVYGHVSHTYVDGANLYMIFHGDAEGSEQVAALYAQVLKAAFVACTREGGSLSHHHGIGLGKAKWLALEYGREGVGVLQALQRALDPAAVFNPGKLGSCDVA